MGVFKLPFSVCDELTRMVRGFYWGSSNGKRKVHWRAWDDLLPPKNGDPGQGCSKDAPKDGPPSGDDGGGGGGDYTQFYRLLGM